MSTDDTQPQPPESPTGAASKEELMAQGWPEEHAEYLARFDAAVQGQDASVVIPVTLYGLQALTRMLTPEAQRGVATLMSDTAMQIGQAAANTERDLQVLEQAANEQGDQDGASNPDADHPPGPDTVQ